MSRLINFGDREKAGSLRHLERWVERSHLERTAQSHTLQLLANEHGDLENREHRVLDVGRELELRDDHRCCSWLFVLTREMVQYDLSQCVV